MSLDDDVSRIRATSRKSVPVIINFIVREKSIDHKIRNEHETASKRTKWLLRERFTCTDRTARKVRAAIDEGASKSMRQLAKELFSEDFRTGRNTTLQSMDKCMMAESELFRWISQEAYHRKRCPVDWWYSEWKERSIRLTAGAMMTIDTDILVNYG